MASWLEGFREGKEIGKDFVEPYFKGKERGREMGMAYRDRLAAQKLAAEEKQYNRGRDQKKDAEAVAKQRYDEFESGVKMDQAQGKQSFDQSIESAKLAWMKDPRNAANVKATEASDIVRAAELKGLETVIDAETESAQKAGATWWKPASFEEPVYETGQKEKIEAAKKRYADILKLPSASRPLSSVDLIKKYGLPGKR